MNKSGRRWSLKELHESRNARGDSQSHNIFWGLCVINSIENLVTESINERGSAILSWVIQIVISLPSNTKIPSSISKNHYLLLISQKAQQSVISRRSTQSKAVERSKNSSIRFSNVNIIPLTSSEMGLHETMLLKWNSLISFDHFRRIIFWNNLWRNGTILLYIAL